MLSLLEDHAENYLEIKPVLDHIGEDVVTAMIQEQEKNYDQCMMELDGQLAEKRDQKEKWEMNLAFEMQIKKALEIMKSVAFSKKSFSHSCYQKKEAQLWDYITKRIKENLAKTQLM